jgi:hypothetical protein
MKAQKGSRFRGDQTALFPEKDQFYRRLSGPQDQYGGVGKVSPPPDVFIIEL